MLKCTKVESRPNRKAKYERGKNVIAPRFPRCDHTNQGLNTKSTEFIVTKLGTMLVYHEATGHTASSYAAAPIDLSDRLNML